MTALNEIKTNELAHFFTLNNA